MIDRDGIELLTFDCYGTLIDWESGIFSALDPLLRKKGIALTRDAILEAYAEAEASIESETYQQYTKVLRGVLQAFANRLSFTIENHETDLLVESLNHWEPFDDTRAALKRLKSQFNLAIVSNIDNNLIAISAAKLGVDFDHIITAEQVGAYKPNLKVFEFALDTLGIGKSSVLHIAQSLYHDIEPARQLGLKTVWVNRRHAEKGSGATPVSDAVPDYEVPDLKTLAAKLACE